MQVCGKEVAADRKWLMSLSFLGDFTLHLLMKK